MVGKVNIHFCNTVHKFGVDFPGVMALMASSGILGFDSDISSDSSSSDFSIGIFDSVTMGRRACHSPSRRATARQTSSRVRSSGVHARP